MAAIKSGAIRVEGLRELTKFLRTLPPEVTDELKNIHARVAQPVYQEAQMLVPRRTGALRQSIRVAKGSKSAAVIRAGKKAVPYAGPIHYGWPARGIRAQPFLINALKKRRFQVFKEYKGEIDRLIHRVGMKTGTF